MYIQMAVAGFVLLVTAIAAGILKTTFQLRGIRRSYSVDAVARARSQHGRDRNPLPAGPASAFFEDFDDEDFYFYFMCAWCIAAVIVVVFCV